MNKPVALSAITAVCLLVAVVVVASNSKVAASACTPAYGNACGYFKDSFMNANDNVLPPPALSAVTGASGNAAKLAAFKNTLYNDLKFGTYHQKVGAAFLIDAFMGYRNPSGGSVQPVGGGIGAGVSAANTYWDNGSFTAKVDFYANTTNPSVYGVQWFYKPADYKTWCGNGGRIDSGYDDFRGDVALYPMYPWWSGNCSWEYSQSMPEIRFYWNSFAGTFDIGTLCGNLQDSGVVPPAGNNPPYGQVLVSCNTATGQYEATMQNFGDPDGTTWADITTSTGGWTSSVAQSPGPAKVVIPLSQTQPYSPVTVYINVKDVGPVADQQFHTVNQIQTPPPCVVTSCGSPSVTPARLDPYMDYSVTVSLNTQVGISPPSPNTFKLTILSPTNVQIYSATMNGTNSGNTASATFAGIPKVSNSGFGAGTYKLSWQFSGSGLTPPACPGTFPVVFMPYLNVYGGDVAVGTSPTFAAGTSSCASPNTAGGAFSWNNHSAGFSGAGAQYAVQTLAGIVDFASALSSNNTPPTGLSFANYFTPADPLKVNTGNGLFGGYFGGVLNDCDFTHDLTTAPTTVDTTIPATAVGPNTNTVRYISGADVYISGNVAFTGDFTVSGQPGWNSVQRVPSFKLIVVGGDIYIDRSVTQLDGVYVAESSGTTGGRIFTCSTGFRSAVDLATPGNYATCNKQLVINGAFVAKYVSFGRTFGTVGQATVGDSLTSNHDAEVFNFTPELWLPRGASSPADGYTAITGLPPVL